jgi:TolB-like protein
VQPPPDDVRRELERIIASSGFANAERMSRFLRYVVERAIAGESEQIKEYAIGVDVFGRSADYDPRLDSIVRVEARRLRSKLDEYYAGEGRNDEVVISIRRGTYVPVFEHKAAAAGAPGLPTPAEAPADRASLTPTARSLRATMAIALVAVAVVSFAAWRGLWSAPASTPTMNIAVLPFTQYSTATDEVMLAGRLTEEVTSELARLKVARVIAHTSVLQFAGTRTPATQIAETLNADLLIEGSVARNGEALDTSIRLVGGRSNYKLWVQSYSGSVNDPRELARRIAAGTAEIVASRATSGNRDTRR